MLRFCANISFLFCEYPFLERFAAAREAGFRAVEFHFPYEFDPVVVAQAALKSEQEIVLFNLPAGSSAEWASGGRGIACHPLRVDEFKAGLEMAIAYARLLDCRRLNCLAGIPPAGVALAEARQTLIDNLRCAASVTREARIQLMMEPLNTNDVPGFLVSTTAQALATIAAVAGDNLYLQYDLYHAQVMEGNLTNTLRENLSRVGHIQLADNPGRHEPGTGEINFPFVLKQLDSLGYLGWIGCEYIPSTSTSDSFSWLQRWLKSVSHGRDFRDDYYGIRT